MSAAPSVLPAVADEDVMWLLRLTMRLPRPLARAWKRFSIGASSTVMRVDLQLVDVRAVVVLGVGDRRLEHLAARARRPSSA